MNNSVTKQPSSSKCAYCTMEFTTQDECLKHIRYKHPNKKRYSCLKCARRFSSSRDIRLHFWAKHRRDYYTVNNATSTSGQRKQICSNEAQTAQVQRQPSTSVELNDDHSNTTSFVDHHHSTSIDTEPQPSTSKCHSMSHLDTAPSTSKLTAKQINTNIEVNIKKEAELGNEAAVTEGTMDGNGCGRNHKTDDKDNGQIISEMETLIVSSDEECFQCPQCKRYFDSMDKIKKHNLKVHQSMTCYGCALLCENGIQLIKHQSKCLATEKTRLDHYSEKK